MLRPILLVVDDVKECADGLVEQLEGALAPLVTVETADSADEAREVLDALETEGGTLALVLSDLIMPQQDGARLLVELHQCQPRALKLLYSGCPRADDLLFLLARGRVDGFFVKPWREAEVVALVTRCLAQLAWPLAPNLSLLEGSLPPQTATPSETEALRLLQPHLRIEGLEALLIWLETPRGLRLSSLSRFRGALATQGPDYYRHAADAGVSPSQTLAYLQQSAPAWRSLIPLEAGGDIRGWLLAENPLSAIALTSAQHARLERLAETLGTLVLSTRLLSLPTTSPG